MTAPRAPRDPAAEDPPTATAARLAPSVPPGAAPSAALASPAPAPAAPPAAILAPALCVSRHDSGAASAALRAQMQHLAAAGIPKHLHEPTTTADLPQASTTTSAGAAFTRSILLFMGFMFRRPSKLFRPNRLDTWAGLRQLAESADQNLSPAFVRGLIKLKGGPVVLMLTLLPPMVVNATLGFLLFSSHSLLSLYLARLPYFQRRVVEVDDTVVAETNAKDLTLDEFIDDLLTRDILGAVDGDYGEAPPGGVPAVEEAITLETIIRGPKTVPAHPTLLAAIAGAGAGVIQGVAFTPIENIVRFAQQSATMITTAVARFLRIPTPKSAQLLGPPPASPLEALHNLIASSSWNKSASWWSGWRWAVSRDAASYATFFATFDLTRRVGLRVKANMTKKTNPNISTAAAMAAKPSETPTTARIAQAGTIVAGGIVAASAAEFTGRPFRQCSRICRLAAAERTRLTTAGAEIPLRFQHPIRNAYRLHGLQFFFRSTLHHEEHQGSRLVRLLTRAGWRVASVTPWGVGFLVFAWIGGEV